MCELISVEKLSTVNSLIRAFELTKCSDTSLFSIYLVYSQHISDIRKHLSAICDDDTSLPTRFSQQSTEWSYRKKRISQTKATA